MKFSREFDREFVDTTFEVDTNTDFSEQYVAMAALGSLALMEQDELTRKAISFLAVKLRKANPVGGSYTENNSSDKPKEVATDLTPQEADTLLGALQYFRTLERVDIDNFGIMRNYQAVSTRIVENAMAESMEKQLRTEFELDLTKPALKSMIGFGAILAESE